MIHFANQRNETGVPPPAFWGRNYLWAGVTRTGVLLGLAIVLLAEKAIAVSL